MILFAYLIFRIFLLFVLNIGWDTQPVYAQNKPRRIPVDTMSSRDSVDFKHDKVIDAALDSTLKAVQELRDISNDNKKGAQKNRQIAKKLDASYYNTIIPLKKIDRQWYTKMYSIGPRVTTLPHIPSIVFQNEQLCVDSLPLKIDPEVPLSRVKRTFFQKVKHIFRKKKP